MSEANLTLKLADKRNLGYSRFGDSSGRPVLYFHGGISSRLDIAFAANYCKKNGICIIAPDRPGTGLSDRKSGRSVLDFVDDVRELMDALNIERCPVFGWSLAGPYVLACAAKEPQRFSALATVGGVSPLDSKAAVQALGLQADRLLFTCPKSWKWLLAAVLNGSSRIPPGILKYYMEKEVASAPDRAIVSKLDASDVAGFVLESLRQGGYGVLDDYQAVAEDWGFTLADVKLPAQIFHGQEDAVCSMSHAERMKNEIKGAVLHLVPGEGHFLLHNHLEAVLATIL
ncbi:MAG TPA: alpha/beta hydrolase [Candidatus Obscuribacter sp.]|nr:alpha/beta hydrolase [Candidatus Obscuribacter sp.]